MGVGAVVVVFGGGGALALVGAVVVVFWLVFVVVVVFWLAGGVAVLGVGAVVGVVPVAVALSISGVIIRLNQARASQSQK